MNRSFTSPLLKWWIWFLAFAYPLYGKNALKKLWRSKAKRLQRCCKSSGSERKSLLVEILSLSDINDLGIGMFEPVSPMTTLRTTSYLSIQWWNLLSWSSWCWKICMLRSNVSCPQQEVQDEEGVWVPKHKPDQRAVALMCLNNFNFTKSKGTNF